jgi:hypothetical protein
MLVKNDSISSGGTKSWNENEGAWGENEGVPWAIFIELERLWSGS